MRPRLLRGWMRGHAVSKQSRAVLGVPDPEASALHKRVAHVQRLAVRSVLLSVRRDVHELHNFLEEFLSTDKGSDVGAMLGYRKRAVHGLSSFTSPAKRRVDQLVPVRLDVSAVVLQQQRHLRVLLEPQDLAVCAQHTGDTDTGTVLQVPAVHSHSTGGVHNLPVPTALERDIHSRRNRLSVRLSGALCRVSARGQDVRAGYHKHDMASDAVCRLSARDPTHVPQQKPRAAVWVRNGRVMHRHLQGIV